jgi:P63C domain
VAENDKLIMPIEAPFDKVARAMVAAATPRKMPKALYQGPLPIGDTVLDCVVLDDADNTRVISMTSVFRAFGRVARSNNRVINIPAFIDAQNLQEYIDQELKGLIKPIQYIDGRSVQTGYNALILPAICDLYLKARRERVLTGKQAHLAEKAEILQSSFAKLGIIALVDEATGFQLDRKHDALRMLLSKYIAEGLQKWIHTFPDSFFAELDRLYDNAPTHSRNRPQYYGGFINKYVYEPIENGYVKAELDKLNITDKGKRKARFHQWLSEEGRTILTRQIGKVEGTMEMCADIEHYKTVAKRQKTVTIAPYLFNEMNRIIE